MSRPAVDVVIPFAGSTAALRELVTRVRGLADTVTVVDNRVRADRPAPPEGVRLIEAARVHSSYHARNAGARGGTAPWILFLDADVEAPRDLADRYFDRAPAERTAVLAGAIRDLPGPRPAQRYAALTHAMAQASGYAQTANCMIRRDAFAQAGGFREVRSGADAELCFRLRDAGWELEHREEAAVDHRSRATIAKLLAQKAKHGGGAAWVERERPGSFPPRPLLGAAKYAVGRGAAGAAALARGDRDAALVGLLDGPSLLAFELGRRAARQRDRD